MNEKRERVRKRNRESETEFWIQSWGGGRVGVVGEVGGDTKGGMEQQNGLEGQG